MEKIGDNFVSYLYMDCFAGLGGDMFLAAAADLGVDLALLQDVIREAWLNVSISAEETRVEGLRGRRLVIRHPATQPLRRLDDLLDLAERLDVEPGVRADAIQAFVRLAGVEAAVHGVDVDQVHFHEVGAVDTFVDVVGAFYAVHALGVEKVVCSQLPWFRGHVQCAHGTLPLPAPAAAELLKGKPVYPTDVQTEIITPTGALIIDRLASEFLSGPVGRVQAMGTSFGSKIVPGGPNGFRLFLVR